MTIVDQVRAARNPQEAMLAIAAALDVILEEIQRMPESVDPWGAWPSEEEYRERADPGKAADILRKEDYTDIVFKAPSVEKQERRRLLATQQLKLEEMLRDVDPDYAWTEAYVKGGPLWLYHGNRELLMSYDEPIRRQMIEDVLEDSPEQAHLMSIDILKQPAGEPDLETGAGALAVGWITGKGH